MNIEITGPHLNQGMSCEPILRALPDWFGIEEAIIHYVAEINRLPTLIASQAETIVGFLALKQHSPYAAEVYVMAIDAAHQQQGIGRALMQQAEAYLRRQGIEYLQVKTLSAAHPDPYYAKTRAFYAAMGMRALEEFPTLWDEQNPCLLMIKRL